MALLARVGAREARIAAVSALASIGAAGMLAACSPSMPSTPESYVVPAVGDMRTTTDGAAVASYRRVFGDAALVYAVGPEDATSGLPAAMVAVVMLDAGTTESDVAARALGPGDEVDDREIDGANVRSATSRQGDITLHVRIWQPAGDVVVVVIGTRAPEDADAVAAAIVGQVRQSGSTERGDKGDTGGIEHG